MKKHKCTLKYNEKEENKKYKFLESFESIVKDVSTEDHNGNSLKPTNPSEV